MATAMHIVTSLTILALGAPAFGQVATMTYVSPYDVAYGNGDAGVTLEADSYLYGKKEHKTVYYNGHQIRTYFGDGQATMNARLNASFLGTSREVAYFRGSLRGYATFTFIDNPAWPLLDFTESGSVFLRLAGTTLWNKSFTRQLQLAAAMTLRVASPTLVFIVGAVPVTLSGALNGSINTQVNLDLFAPHYSVDFDGTARAAASGSASATIWGPIVGGATVQLTVDTQTLDADVKVQLPVATTWSSPADWIKGKVVYHRGTISAFIKGWVYVPWKVSRTLVDWVLGAQSSVLFER